MKAGSSLDSRLMVPQRRKNKKCWFQAATTEFSNVQRLKLKLQSEKGKRNRESLQALYTVIVIFFYIYINNHIITDSFT